VGAGEIEPGPEVGCPLKEDQDQAGRRDDQADRYSADRVKLRRPASRPLAFQRPATPATPPATPPAADQARRVTEPAPVRSTTPPSELPPPVRARAIATKPSAVTPHPRSKARAGARPLGATRPSIDLGASMRAVRRTVRPGRRTGYLAAGIVTVVAVVFGMMALLPSVPATPSATGSIYQVNWKSATTSPTRFDFGPYFATFGDTLMMLGTTGLTTTVWSSDDGSAWTKISDEGEFVISGRRFVAQGFSADGSGGLVAIGNSVGSGANDVAATAWHSKDGRGWSQATVNSGKGQEMIGGAASKPGIVVTAGYGVAWASSDGVNWTAHVLPGAINYLPRVVAAWDGGFVIVGLSTGGGDTKSAVWYSETGDAWIMSTTVLDGFDARGIASNGKRVVVVGADTSDSSDSLAASWSSTDGNAWVKASARTDQADTAIDGVTLVNGAFVAVGAADKSLSGSSSVAPGSLALWVSEDGTWWLPLASSASPVTRARVATLRNRVVLVGGVEGGQRTLDGEISLGPVRAPTASPAAPLQYALTLKSGETPMIADITKNDVLGPVVATADRFLTFITRPAGTTVWSSPNGGLWAQEVAPAGLVTPTNNGRPVILNAISDGKGGVLAVGKVTSSAGDTGTIWHLPKGGDWHQATLEDDAPPEFTNVAVGEKGYVAVSDKAGGSIVMYSSDGETWNAGAISVTTAANLLVTSYQYGFVIVASDKARGGATNAWTSPDGRTWSARSEWALPLNVTAILGTSSGIVAVTSGSGVAPSASASATPKPSPTKAGALASGNWWWSSTGLVWRQTGLTATGAYFGLVNGRIVAFSPPSKVGDPWTGFSSADGRTWQTIGKTAVTFAGVNVCRIASSGSRVVVIGWQATAQLKDFYGSYAGS
jgi:hypothetical protein